MGTFRYDEIGQRLRAFRLASGLSADEIRKRMPETMLACFNEIFALIEGGRLKAPAHRTYPLADYAVALRALQDRTVRERIILTPGRAA